MLSPEKITQIRKSFAAQAMMTTLGAELSTLEKGAIEISAPVRSEVSQQQGYVHAGLTFAIGDSAAGYSALSLMRVDQEVLTSEMKINLLAPGRGDQLVARGRVIKPGRRLMVVQADVFAVDQGVETQIALLTGTMVPVDLKPDL